MRYSSWKSIPWAILACAACATAPAPDDRTTPDPAAPGVHDTQTAQETPKTDASPPPPPSPSAARLDARTLGYPSPKPDEIARVPLPPGSLKDNLRSGARFVMRVQEAGKDAYFMRTEFVVTNGEGCMMVHSKIRMTDGRVLETRRGEASWAELESHAYFPKDLTTIANDTVDTPLGTMDALRYEIRGDDSGKPTLKRMWFAKSFPGPPVKYEELVDGEVVRTMVMIESHRP